MAKGGANTKGCNCSHSDEHNERKQRAEKEASDKKRRLPLDNPNTSIRPELTASNSSWKAEDVPSLWQLEQNIRRDYAQTERTVKLKDGTTHTCHRELPSKGKTAATPVKETVLLLPTNGPETDAMVKLFAEKVEAATGWRCVRRYVHRDERYDDPDTGEQRFNNHAHLVWDCYDWQKHQIRSVGKAVMRQIQDIAAEVTGMERGTDARVTHAEHLSVAEYKNEQERKRAEELKAQNLALQTQNAQLQRQHDSDEARQCANLQRLGTNMVQQFDRLSDIIDPDEKQRKQRDALSRDATTDTTTMPPAQISVLVVALHNGLDAVATAVANLTERIIKLSKQVPLLGMRSKRLRHEADLQQQVADAQDQATAAEERAKAAEEASQKAIQDLDAQKAAIDALDAKTKQEKAAIDDIKKKRYQAGYLAGKKDALDDALLQQQGITIANRKLTTKNAELQAQIDNFPEEKQTAIDAAVAEKDLKIKGLESQLATVRRLNASYEAKIKRLEQPAQGVKMKR